MVRLDNPSWEPYCRKEYRWACRLTDMTSVSNAPIEAFLTNDTGVMKPGLLSAKSFYAVQCKRLRREREPPGIVEELSATHINR